MGKIGEFVKAGIRVIVLVALVVWAGALVYALVTDPDHTWRYGIKLVLVISTLVWSYDGLLTRKSKPDEE